MKEVNKLLLLAFIFLLFLSCNIPSTGSTTSDNAPMAEPTANPDTPIYYGRVPTESTSLDYLVAVKAATMKGMGGPRTDILLENQSADLVNVADGFNYTLIYLDEKDNTVTEQTLDEVSSIFPGEKQLVYFALNIPAENRERKITRARFVINKIVPANINLDYYDRVRSLSLPRPIVAVTGQPYQIEINDQGFFKSYNAKTSVTLQNNLGAQIEVEAVALFLDANGEIVGEGRTGGVTLAANGQATAEITAFDLCGEVARVEYHAFPYRRTGWSEVYYEAMQ